MRLLQQVHGRLFGAQVHDLRLQVQDIQLALRIRQVDGALQIQEAPMLQDMLRQGQGHEWPVVDTVPPACEEEVLLLLCIREGCGAVQASPLQEELQEDMHWERQGQQWTLVKADYAGGADEEDLRLAVCVPEAQWHVHAEQDVGRAELPQHLWHVHGDNRDDSGYGSCILAWSLQGSHAWQIHREQVQEKDVQFSLCIREDYRKLQAQEAPMLQDVHWLRQGPGLLGETIQELRVQDHTLRKQVCILQDPCSWRMFDLMDQAQL
jgi:hypothetical protein